MLIKLTGEPSLTTDETINMLLCACMVNRDLKEREQAELLDQLLLSICVELP